MTQELIKHSDAFQLNFDGNTKNFTRFEPGGDGVAQAVDVAMDLFGFILMTLGSFTLAAIVGLALWSAWTSWGRDLWAAKFGAAPF